MVLERSKPRQVPPRTFRALHELAVATSGVLDPVALARQVIDCARDLLGIQVASLYGWDSDEGLLVALATHDPHAPPGQPPLRLQPGDGALGASDES